MKLEGIHHITAITGDAAQNLDFYTRVLGLRLVKKTVNQDEPTVYHLFYADEAGSPGADLTFFEFPGAAPGRPGAGMVHRIDWRVASPEAIDFWEERLTAEGTDAARVDGGLRFTDPEGMSFELKVDDSGDPALIADHPQVPREVAIQGFDGVRAYTGDPERSRALLQDTLGFQPSGNGAWEVRGDRRGGHYAYDVTDEPAYPGAGTIHHIAFATETEEQDAWRAHVAKSGNAHPTPVIDRFWFKSVYFREPSGVLFELATMGPGFAADEDPDHLGEKLVLPPRFEPLRAEIEPRLTPLPDPRADWATR